MRLALRLAAGAAALVILVLAIGILFVRSAEQDRSGRFLLSGLEASVEVRWTDHAVPHVWASSLADAVSAQGFLHARDRLWQMELVRRAIQGRLAEVMGEPALGTDRFMRRLGLWDAARASLDRLPETDVALLKAYADGVNAALETWEGALPPEFLVLGYAPEPWEPIHTVAVAKMMSFTLAAYGETTAVARALRRLPEERVRWLFPDFPDWGTTILPPEPPETPPLASALVNRFSMAAASNAWVVDGSRTESGKPLLANDMHLDLQAPSLWYLMALHAPVDAERDLDVMGVTIPGAPMVITGRNRALAWGFTNAYVDDVDIFLERVDPDDPTRYLTPGGTRPFRVVAETLAVKGRDDSEIMEVRWTRHGPVLPTDGASGDTVMAVRWTAHEPTTVVRGILQMNLARNWEEFLEGVDLMDDPHQNVVYGDTAGHIGYIMGGTVPIRGNRRPAPVAPRPGWTGQWDWTGELPFHEHPRALDPLDGFVATANNRQTAEPIAELISASWLQPFRAQRITELIVEATEPLNADDVLAMQLDVLDPYAVRYGGRAIQAARDRGLETQARLLESWDRRARGDSRAATLFYAWNEIFRRALARDLYGGEPAYFTRASVGAVLDQGAVPWADRPEHAFRAMAGDALEEAVQVAGDIRWEDANRAIHSHALGDVALLDRLLNLNVGPHPYAGAPTTLNVAHWAFQTPTDGFPFRTTSGPSMRQVVDLGNTGSIGGFVIPTGQSGLPFSRHYDDQNPLWRFGELLTLSLDRGRVTEAALQEMILEPEQGTE